MDDYETHKDELIERFSNKIKEFQECQKKNNNLESKIKHLKNTIKDNENHIESLCSKLNKREQQIELLSNEIDSVKKSKTMIELILTKTNTEIEAIHEEHDEKVKKLQSIIDEYKNIEKLSNQNIIDLENNMKNVQNNLANKEHIIIFYEEKMAENYQIVGTQEEQLRTMYQEKLMLESHLKNIKNEIETQQKSFNEKNCEMENCLEYYLDELKNLNDEKTKIGDILQCNQNKIEQQLKLIKNQEDIIKKLQSEQCSQQLIISDLNKDLQQKSSENNNLCAKVLESTLELDKLKEQLNAALVENNVIKTNLRNDELQIKTMNEEFQSQLNDMKKVLENQNNQCLIKVEKLQDTLEKKQNDFNEQLITCNKLTETISQLHLEKNELEEKLISIGQDLNQKQILFEQTTEENNKLKETVDYTENQCINLQQELKELNNIILQKEEDIKLLKVHISECSVSKESLQKQIIELQQILDNKHVELEKQIQWCNEQGDTIIKLNDEKECLSNEIKNLEDSLSHNEYKFNLCEGKLYDCSNTIETLETKINTMNNEKSLLELQLNETITKLINTNQDLTLKLEIKETNVLEIQEKLILEQNELKKQIEKSNEQIEKISLLNADNDKLQEETNKLQKCMNINENTLKLLQEKLLICEKDYKELQTLKTNSVSELNEKLLKLTNLHQESKKQLEDMDIKYIELQEKFSKNQVELDEYISKYNTNMKRIADLTSERDNLINRTHVLESTLLNKDNVISANQEKLLEYEEINDKIITEKGVIEIKLENIQQNLTQKLEVTNKKLQEVEVQLINQKEELDEQSKCSIEQVEKINSLMYENNNLVNETNKLKECLVQKEFDLRLNQNKLQDLDKQNKEIECQNMSLVIKLNELKCQLNNLSQESTEEIDKMDKKLSEAQNQLSLKQSEIKLKNDSITDIYQKIKYLKDVKIEVESILKKERKYFETCFETCLNYSFDYIKNNPILDHHHDSLIEVITSADTFIEHNGIQLAQVENSDVNSIIERVKKIFEALKMFIINLKTQGTEQIMNHTNNESNEAYTELLALSKTYVIY